MKFTYTTDAQLVEDMEKAILKEHLAYSGSGTRRPSSASVEVKSAGWITYVEAHEYELDEVTEDEGNEAYEHACQFMYEVDFTPLYKKACRNADAKWEAAMLLLGIDD